jgi:cell cycle checkpoint protein
VCIELLSRVVTTNLDATGDSDNAFASSSSDPYSYNGGGGEALFTKFEAFLGRASTCGNLFTSTQNDPKPSSSSSSSDKSSTPQPPAKPKYTRRIILLEDLPNILHANTRTQFHELLHSLVVSPQQAAVPIVIVLSDAGLRGEASDERLSTGVWKRDSDGVLDIRTVLSKDLLHGPYVTQVRLVRSIVVLDHI